MTFTPDSPWIGSISTAGRVLVERRRGISARGHGAEARDQRRERRLLGLLRGRADSAP